MHPPQHSRRQSTNRQPPVLPPGMPVKANQYTQYTAGHYRPAMPSNRPGSYTSSSSASPALSYDSFSSGPLGSSTRVNIKGSAPPRQVSSTLDWDRSPKEPEIVTPEDNYTPQMEVSVEDQFEHLLDTLQVPLSVRQKFAAVSPDVKTSILHSSVNSNPAILSALGLPVPKETPKVKKRMSTPLLRKAKSSSELESPGASPQVGKTYAVNGDAFTIIASPAAGPKSPIRGQSMDIARQRCSQGPRPISMGLFGASGSSVNVASGGKAAGKGLGIAMGEQPEAFLQWLNSYKATDLRMEVARCKKLRMLLRHESTDWVGSFIEQGGYKLILGRIQDLLDVEWREEQHDDQMLYELLRCVKALCTSEVGKKALRDAFPRPFPELSKLLFSEKKPGDLASRQIIVEMWLFLFDLFPAQAQGRPGGVRFQSVNVTDTVRGLLVPDAEDPAKDQHAFITVSHRPRVFKAWVQELSDICRDYFWIMCHGSNTLWAVEEVDDSLVERPVAPGGATGGVEFEAMNYAAVHFKLLNALCAHTAREDLKKARQLHNDLLQSGMDRILVTMRKASTTYYPALHLELARYVALLRGVSHKGQLPHLIDRLVGSPPEGLRKRQAPPNFLPMPSFGSTRAF